MRESAKRSWLTNSRGGTASCAAYESTSIACVLYRLAKIDGGAPAVAIASTLDFHLTHGALHGKSLIEGPKKGPRYLAAGAILIVDHSLKWALIQF